MAATRQTAEDEIRGLLEAWANATRAKDVGAIVAGCAAELLAFDCRGPLRFKGADAFRKVLDLRPWRAGRSKGDSSMQKISPFLWFDNQAEEAMNFYVPIFKNSKVGSVTRYGDAGPGPRGSVMTASFELEGQQFTALNGGPHFKFTEAISFVVSCETQEEVNELWDKLAEGGQTQQCGWLKDKFGLSWQIIPSALIELMSDPDPREIAKGHGSDVSDDQDRDRGIEAGIRGVSLTQADASPGPAMGQSHQQNGGRDGTADDQNR